MGLGTQEKTVYPMSRRKYGTYVAGFRSGGGIDPKDPFFERPNAARKMRGIFFPYSSDRSSHAIAGRYDEVYRPDLYRSVRGMNRPKPEITMNAFHL